jgi:hypothetical protein
VISFCFALLGAGKSHTLNIVLENCLINCDYPKSNPLIQLHQPMCGLVLHYDQCETNICEATGLSNLSNIIPNTNSSLKSKIRYHYYIITTCSNLSIFYFLFIINYRC